jgi:RimJ/RimL family protein N-acetyltransferase
MQQGNVRFTPLQMENIHTHFRWKNDPELHRLDSETPYEEESFGDFKERFEALCAEAVPTQRHFEVHEAATDALVGVAYAIRIRPHHRRALVGVTIGEKELWGKGYGRDALRLLLQYCFQDLDLHRVGATTFEYNTAWRDLLESVGFRREGVAREALYRDGQFWDKGHYALLRREYTMDEEAASSAPA